MNKEQIIEVLNKWNFWNKNFDVGVQRNSYLENLKKLVKTGQIVAVTGVRRSGKSTLLKQFIQMQIVQGEEKTLFLYVNLEEPTFTGLLSLEFLNTIYQAYLEILKPKSKPYIILDEVQKVPEWEKFVRGIHEKNEAHILISGSASHIVEGNMGVLLTGRWVHLKVYPLSFKEFLSFKNIQVQNTLDILSQNTIIKGFLREYLEFGGFPLAVLTSEKEEILNRYFDDIVTRDVSEKYHIRKTEKVKTLAKYYLTTFSSRVSYRNISSFIGLSLDSVERYSSYLTESSLIYFVKKFSYSLLQQEKNQRKVYGSDTGLINSASLKFSENIGKLYENTTFLHLCRQEKEVYYYAGKKECDFVIKEGKNVTQVIQVAYIIHENKKREVEGLLEAMTFFKLQKGTILTENVETEEKIEGKTILYKPLWKWLLQ